MRNVLVIMGSHPRTRPEFDWTRQDCDVWVFNEALSLKDNTAAEPEAKQMNKWVGRVDAVFQMHEPTIWKNPNNRNDPNHYRWLTSGNTPAIFMQEQYAEVPQAVKYPLEEIVARFGFRYFTSSIAYAIALGCYLGYKRMELYGVEMESNTEYQYQREGVALWLGVARGLGMDVDAHIKMLDAPLYGYDGEVVMPDDFMQKAIAELAPQIAQAEAEYHAAAQNAKKELAAMLDGDNSKALGAAVHDMALAASRWGSLDGKLQEYERYQKKADDMRAASGKFLFSRQEFEHAFQKLAREYNAWGDKTNHAGGAAAFIEKELVMAAKGSPKRQAKMQELGVALQRYIETQRQACVYEGAATVNHDAMKWLDEHIRAAGGVKSEQAILEALANA